MAEANQYRDLFDAACVVLKTPDSTNDMGPGDLAEDIRNLLHNHGVIVDDLMRESRRAEAERDELRALLLEVVAAIEDELSPDPFYRALSDRLKAALEALAAREGI